MCSSEPPATSAARPCRRSPRTPSTFPGRGGASASPGRGAKDGRASRGRSGADGVARRARRDRARWWAFCAREPAGGRTLRRPGEGQHGGARRARRTRRARPPPGPWIEEGRLADARDAAELSRSISSTAEAGRGDARDARRGSRGPRRRRLDVTVLKGAHTAVVISRSRACAPLRTWTSWCPRGAMVAAGRVLAAEATAAVRRRPARGKPTGSRPERPRCRGACISCTRTTRAGVELHDSLGATSSACAPWISPPDGARGVSRRPPGVRVLAPPCSPPISRCTLRRSCITCSSSDSRACLGDGSGAGSRTPRAPARSPRCSVTCKGSASRCPRST